MIQLLCRKIGQYLSQSQLCLPFGPGIPLLEIYSKDTTVQIENGMCTKLFIETSVTSKNKNKNKKPGNNPNVYQ